MSELSLQERFAAAAWHILTDETVRHAQEAVEWAARFLGAETAGAREAIRRKQLLVHGFEVAQRRSAQW